MTHIQLAAAVSAAMRAMGKEPSALLFVDGVTDWTCDSARICGIPVFHAVGMACSRWGTGVVDGPVIPIGRTENEITYQDRRLFADAFGDAIQKEET